MPDSTVDSTPRPTPDPPADPTPRSEPSASGRSIPPPAETSADPPADAIELSFVGDIIFGHYFSRGYVRHRRKGEEPLAAVKPLLAADLVVANLETPLQRQLPARSPVNSRYRFGAEAAAAQVLRQGGIGAVTLSNNHAADLKLPGLFDTPAILREQGILPLGEARRPCDGPAIVVQTIEVRGVRIGIIALSTQLNVPLPVGATIPRVPVVADTTAIRRTVGPLLSAARAEHDLLAVLLHWGSQFTEQPSTPQRRAAHALIEDGADLVIGHHPHVLQGVERYRHGVIAYSLGNFLFPDATGAPRLTGVLRLRYQRALRRIDHVQFRPAVAQVAPHHSVAPVPATGRAGEEVRARVQRLSARLGTRFQVIDDHLDLPLPALAPDALPRLDEGNPAQMALRESRKNAASGPLPRTLISPRASKQ